MSWKPLTQMEALAVEVSRCAPLQNPPADRVSGRSAYIPWRLVIAIREELEQKGVDWRSAVKARRKLIGYKT
jgi:hypothetical protein